jgi:hypothetical protein
MRTTLLLEAEEKSQRVLKEGLKQINNKISSVVTRPDLQNCINMINVRFASDKKYTENLGNVEIPKCTNRIDILQKEIDQLKIHVSNNTNVNLAGSSSGINLGAGGFNMGAIGTSVGSTSAALPSAAPAAAPSLSAFVQLDATVKTLKTEVLLLRADKDSLVVRFGALGFRQLADAQAYVSSSPGALNYGLIVDIYTICLLVTKEIDGEENFLTKLEKVAKLKLASPCEATVLSAFSSPIPELFTDAGHGIYGKNESAFSKYTTFKKWKEGVEIIKETITVVKEGLTKAIEGYISPASPAHSVMVLSVTEACSNLKDFCEWMTSTSESLETYGMSATQSWYLTTRLGEAYFRSLNRVRSGVSDSFETANQINMAGTVWYAVTRTLDIMEEFSSQDFKNHPSIAGEYIKFMVQNTNRDTASTFDEKFKTLEQQGKDAKKEAASALKAVSAASSRSEVAVKEIAILKKTVAALEKRVKDIGAP